jgi:glycosyltransferase involved in cell wall biosynthesis
MPIVSVVIPTHNRPALLAEALASVKAQTFHDYEIIVVSNGENKDARGQSLAAATSCGARYFALDEGNLPAARNFGVAHAAGKYIAFLDDDDLFIPEKLEWQVAEIERTGTDVLAADYQEFWPDGRSEIRRPRLPDGLSYAQAITRGRWWTAIHATLISRRVFETVVFDPHLKGSEDNDFWRRASWQHTICHLDRIVAAYRRGHASATSNRRAESFNALAYYRKMVRDTPADLRDALPTFAAFAMPCFVNICLPGAWDRFMELRGRLRLRTRAKALVARLIS